MVQYFREAYKESTNFRDEQKQRLWPAAPIPAWLEQSLSSRGIQLPFYAQIRRRSFILTSTAVATALLLLVVLFFRRSAGPPPFFCSTWDSASAAPSPYYPEVLNDWLAWTSVDVKRFVQPSLGPQAAVASSTSPRAFSNSSKDDTPASMADRNKWKKPEGFKIVAMIFFGRPHQVDIIDCYLQQNLAIHGGFLDEVHFIAHTPDEPALEWLDNLVARSPGYKRLESGPECTRDPHRQDCRYERIWERYATESDTLYIKIDDDVVFIHEDTIPSMVYKRIEHPHPFAISANLINSPTTSWLHYHADAVYPYLPEPLPIGRKNASPPTWRASELPRHPHDDQYQSFIFPPTPDESLVNSAMKNDQELYERFARAPFPGHRWLPLSQNSTSLLFTPMSRASLDPWGPSVHHWGLAAQQHYSLLQNIESGTLYKYHVAPSGGPGLWNMQYTRYNLNFIAVWGRDVAQGIALRRSSGPTHWDSRGPRIGETRAEWAAAGRAWASGLSSNMRDDEKNITADMPRALGRPMVIDMHALVAHMHFHDQEPGMQMTDLLDRWRAYANERVCSPRRQKRVPGQAGGLGWDEGNAGFGWWQCPFVQW